MNFSFIGNCVFFIFTSIFHFNMAYHEITMNFTVGTNNVKQVVDIKADSSILIQAIDIPQEISSVMFQAHTQKIRLTLSQYETPLFHYSVNGTNVGLIAELHGRDTVAKMWVHNYSNRNSSLLIILIPLKEYDPVAGGCNMEFPVSTSPFLRLSYGKMSINLEYEHANIGTPRDARPSSCSKAANILSYHINVLFLEDDTYGEQEYYSGIKNMNDISFINSFSKKVNTFDLHPSTRATFYAYPNIGAVYNVVARYYNNGVVKEAVYVPSVTYGCEVLDDYSCLSSGIPRPVFMIILIIAGFQVFLGHRYFNGELFFFGFVVFSFIGYIIFERSSALNETDTFILSGVVGVFSGLIWMLLYNLLGRPVISLFLVGFALGFLLSATAMFTPLGNLEIFSSDRNYWLTLCCGTLLVTVASLPFGVTLSIVASSVVGSFVSILAFEQDRDGALPYILINVIRRAVNGGLAIAYNEYPFKKREIISSCAWVAISIIGISVQFYLARGRPRFPKPYQCCCCQPRVLRCTCPNVAATIVERQINCSDANYLNEHQSLTAATCDTNIPNYGSIQPRV